jgi:hypothetical protein
MNNKSNPMIALQNDPAIKAVAATNAGEIVATLSVETRDYEQAGAKIAERVDVELVFGGATERGQLYFRPRSW